MQPTSITSPVIFLLLLGAASCVCEEDRAVPFSASTAPVKKAAEIPADIAGTDYFGRPLSAWAAELHSPNRMIRIHAIGVLASFASRDDRVVSVVLPLMCHEDRDTRYAAELHLAPLGPRLVRYLVDGIESGAVDPFAVFVFQAHGIDLLDTRLLALLKRMAETGTGHYWAAVALSNFSQESPAAARCLGRNLGVAGAWEAVPRGEALNALLRFGDAGIQELLGFLGLPPSAKIDTCSAEILACTDLKGVDPPKAIVGARLLARVPGFDQKMVDRLVGLLRESEVGVRASESLAEMLVERRAPVSVMSDLGRQSESVFAALSQMLPRSEPLLLEIIQDGPRHMKLRAILCLAIGKHTEAGLLTLFRGLDEEDEELASIYAVGLGRALNKSWYSSHNGWLCRIAADRICRKIALVEKQTGKLSVPLLISLRYLRVCDADLAKRLAALLPDATRIHLSEVGRSALEESEWTSTMSDVGPEGLILGVLGWLTDLPDTETGIVLEHIRKSRQTWWEVEGRGSWMMVIALRFICARRNLLDERYELFSSIMRSRVKGLDLELAETMASFGKKAAEYAGWLEDWLKWNPTGTEERTTFEYALHAVRYY